MSQRSPLDVLVEAQEELARMGAIAEWEKILELIDFAARRAWARPRPISLRVRAVPGSIRPDRMI